MEYVVQLGDTLGDIAVRHNTTLSRLYEDNPDFNPATVLRVGDVLLINSTRPLLSVRTVEYTVHEEEIPVEIRELENHSQPTTFLRVEHEGSPGLMIREIHTTRINNVQYGQPVEAHYHIEVEMLPRIIEVGTQPVIAERR
jgi:hypothetical protein